jgi:hypothetical protein
MSSALARHAALRDAPQLAVYERQQPRERILVAASPREQQSGDVRRLIRADILPTCASS